MTFLIDHRSTTTWSLLTNSVCSVIYASSSPRCAGRKNHTVGGRRSRAANVQRISNKMGSPNASVPSTLSRTRPDGDLETPEHPQASPGHYGRCLVGEAPTWSIAGPVASSQTSGSAPWLLGLAPGSPATIILSYVPEPRPLNDTIFLKIVDFRWILSVWTAIMDGYWPTNVI